MYSFEKNIKFTLIVGTYASYDIYLHINNLKIKK